VLGSSVDIYLKGILSKAVEDVAARKGKREQLPASFTVEIERPKREGQGDRSSSAALQLAKSMGMSPRDLAADIVASLTQEKEEKEEKNEIIEKIETAGPGFINFFLSDKWLSSVVTEILNAGDSYGSSNSGAGRRVQVEFVSANPTGPLHIGHGRGAAVGDALANLLTFTGWKVEREYYINDAGLQMEILGRSTQSRYFELHNRPELAPFPEDGYKGDYIYDLAKDVIAGEKDRFLAVPPAESLPWFKRFAADTILDNIKKDMDDFGVRFDVWFSESDLYARNLVSEAMEHLKRHQLLKTHKQISHLILHTSHQHKSSYYRM